MILSPWLTELIKEAILSLGFEKQLSISHDQLKVTSAYKIQ